MQTRLLLIKIINELDKIARNLVWGSSTSNHKMHLVNWHTLCEPKSHGGLGLHPASDFNKILVMKLTWHFRTEQDKL